MERRSVKSIDASCGEGAQQYAVVRGRGRKIQRPARPSRVSGPFPPPFLFFFFAAPGMGQGVAKSSLSSDRRPSRPRFMFFLSLLPRTRLSPPLSRFPASPLH